MPAHVPDATSLLGVAYVAHLAGFVFGAVIARILEGSPPGTGLTGGAPLGPRWATAWHPSGSP